MRIVSIENDKLEAEFARKAALHFQADPRTFTFAESDPKPGELFAIRWNPFTVLVVKLDDAHEPACYPVNTFIGDDLPKLKGEP